MPSTDPSSSTRCRAKLSINFNAVVLVLLLKTEDSNWRTYRAFFFFLCCHIDPTPVCCCISCRDLCIKYGKPFQDDYGVPLVRITLYGDVQLNCQVATTVCTVVDGRLLSFSKRATYCTNVILNVELSWMHYFAVFFSSSTRVSPAFVIV